MASQGVPKYYYTGNRKLQILHARLRTKCSSLNYDLFLKHITESPLCRCGAIENTDHYLMTCRLYRDQRAELINTLSQQTPVTLHILLYGNSMLSLQAKIIIFEAVRKYINDTKHTDSIIYAIQHQWYCFQVGKLKFPNPFQSTHSFPFFFSHFFLVQFLFFKSSSKIPIIFSHFHFTTTCIEQYFLISIIMLCIYVNVNIVYKGNRCLPVFQSVLMLLL